MQIHLKLWWPSLIERCFRMMSLRRCYLPRNTLIVNSFRTPLVRDVIIQRQPDSTQRFRAVVRDERVRSTGRVPRAVASRPHRRGGQVVQTAQRRRETGMYLGHSRHGFKVTTLYECIVEFGRRHARKKNVLTGDWHQTYAHIRSASNWQRSYDVAHSHMTSQRPNAAKQS